MAEQNTTLINGAIQMKLNNQAAQLASLKRKEAWPVKIKKTDDRAAETRQSCSVFFFQLSEPKPFSDSGDVRLGIDENGNPECDGKDRGQHFICLRGQLRQVNFRVLTVLSGVSTRQFSSTWQSGKHLTPFVC